MGKSGLPDIYTETQGQGLRIRISGKPQVPMLQILPYNTNF